MIALTIILSLLAWLVYGYMVFMVLSIFGIGLIAVQVPDAIMALGVVLMGLALIILGAWANYSVVVSAWGGA